MEGGGTSANSTLEGRAGFCQSGDTHLSVSSRSNLPLTPGQIARGLMVMDPCESDCPQTNPIKNIPPIRTYLNRRGVSDY